MIENGGFINIKKINYVINKSGYRYKVKLVKKYLILNHNFICKAKIT